jgi:hypothetical protein
MGSNTNNKRGEVEMKLGDTERARRVTASNVNKELELK